MSGKAGVKTKVAKSDASVKEEKRTTRSFRKSPARAETKTSSDTIRTKSPTKADNARTKSPTKPDRTASPSRRGRPKLVDRSPSASRKATKSPSRKSPSRKSPVRKSPTRKSPSRRSPARKTDTSTPVVKLTQIMFDSDSDSQSEVHSEYSHSSFKARLRRTPMKDKPDGLNNVTKRPSRHDIERVVSLKTNYESYPKLTEFSDDDLETIKPTEKVETKPPVSSDYRAIFGALFHLLSIPLLLFGILIFCNDTECAFKLPDFRKFRKIDTYFNLSVFLSYIAYVLFVAITSILPFGGKKYSGLLNKSGKLDYVMNGFCTAILILSILVGLEVYKISVFNYIYDNYFRFVVSSFIVSFPLGLLLYIKSCYVPITNLNAESLNKPRFVNFFYGTEINPRFYGLDCKIFLIRICMFSLLILTSTFIHQSLGIYGATSVESSSTLDFKKLTVNPTLLVLCGCYILYALDLLLFEHTLLASLEIQYETLGFLKCVECLTYIGLYALIPKYVLEYNINLATWKLVLSASLFFMGYFLYRASNSQKYEFRQNPYSPKVAYLDSIPTSTGKKLICSSFWGMVRHPNYLGDILIQLSYLPYVLCNPPSIVLYGSILYLLQRAHKDNSRCKAAYGASWDRYCQRVQYILVPKVY